MKTTNTTNTANENKALAALCAHLGANIDSARELSWSHYGLPAWEIEGCEYAIADSDDAADDACEQYIGDSVWAFNASFILSECGLPLALADAIQSFQEKECEGANDALSDLVARCCQDGLAGFARAAIRADGRGHFLSGYDGEEIELAGGAFAYRIN